MKFKANTPPRKFKVGRRGQIEISDHGRIELDPDSQVTFVTEDGKEYDLARKSWGFYATPSLNGRLQQFGLRSALIKNKMGKYYVFLVEQGKEAELHAYLEDDELSIVCWLDNDKSLSTIDDVFRSQKSPLSLERPS